jgi:hypothetical protein
MIEEMSLQEIYIYKKIEKYEASISQNLHHCTKSPFALTLNVFYSNPNMV